MVVVAGVGVEAVEVVEGLGPALGDVGVAEELADHVSVLALHQGVVVAPAGAGLGELDAELFQQLGYPPVDVFGAVVGVEVVEGEGEAVHELLQGRDQVIFSTLTTTSN